MAQRASMGAAKVPELSNPPNPSSGTRTLFPKSDGRWYSQDSDGNEILVGPSVPVGAIHMFAGSTLPAGCLWCAGGSYDPTAYPDLYTAIGTTFGGTSSVPLLPNMNGRFPIGAGTLVGLGATGGSLTNTHNHYTMTSNDGTILFSRPTAAAPRTKVASGVQRSTTSVSMGTGNTRQDSTENEEISIVPPYLSLNFIIQAIG